MLYSCFCFRSSTEDKRPSFVLGQPYSNILVNFMDFTATKKGDSSDGEQVPFF